MRSILEATLQEALKLDLPYANRARLGGQTSAAAVLILFGMDQDQRVSVLFIRRAEERGPHSGQMAFPGGKAEALDQGDPVATALRETHEEVGVERHYVRVLGRLPSVVTPTRFEIAPVVGVLQSDPAELVLKLDPLEVAEAVWIPFADLLTQGVYELELMKYGELNYPVDVFRIPNYRIWGATGSMTKNLIERYHRVARLP